MLKRVALGLILATFFFAPAANAGQLYSCNSGSFLVGIEGRVGAWVDQFHPVCAPWNEATQKFGPTYNGPDFGASTGGDRVPMSICPSGAAVIAITHGDATPDGHQYAQNISLRCADVKDISQTMPGSRGLISDNSPQTHLFGCKANELAIGLNIEFDNSQPKYVGLNCADVQAVRAVTAPAAPPPPPPHPGGIHIHIPHHVIPGTAPTPPPPPVAGDTIIEGNWSSSEGTMTLEQDGKQLNGSYEQDGGRIHAKKQNGTWVGFWSEAKSDQRCKDDRLGTHYWGRIVFLFSNQNRHFDGQWSYCGADVDGAHVWTGDRVK